MQQPPSVGTTITRGASSAKRATALIGSGLLFLGVFCPAAEIIFAGNVSYMQFAPGGALLLLGLAAGSAILALMHGYNWLWLTGGIATGIVVLAFIYNESQLASSDALTQAAVRLEWGWAVMFIGAICIVLAAGMRRAGTSYQGV